MHDQWTLKKRLSVAFAAILLVSGALLTFATVNINKLIGTVGWNTHTYEVLQESEIMLLNMVNIETGLRGFVAAGDEKFLEPLTQGQAAFKAAFDRVKKLTSDNPAQQARLDKMMANHVQFMAVATALKALRADVTAGKASIDELLTEFKLGKDKAAMDAFRAGVAEFSRVEADLLVTRSADMDKAASLTTRILTLGGLAWLCL